MERFLLTNILSEKSYHKTKNKLANAHFTRLCELLKIIQTPYIFNINVKHIRIFIIFDYRFYLFFMLYFYFHGQQVSYGYHDCITTTKSVKSFPSLMGNSDNLFFRYFYIILQRNSLSIHQ